MNKLPLPEDVIFILQKLEEYGYESYIVGGCVRDAILSKFPHDYDICTSALPEEIISCFDGFKTILTGMKYGTVTIVIDDENYEITTYRIDGNYSDGRRPDEVKYTKDIVEDLSRRDFTMNAIAYNPKSGFVDPFYGVNDIKNRIIRCVNNPYDRFSEDTLRILRAWRFSLQLGFDIDADTLYAAYYELYNLSNVSEERIFSELCKALQANFQEKLYHPGSLPFIVAIFPEWKKSIKFWQNNPWHIFDVSTHSLFAYTHLDYENADLITRLATLLHDIGKPESYQVDQDGLKHFLGHAEVGAEMVNGILKRLRADNATREAVVELVKYHDYDIRNTKKSVRKLMNKLGEKQTRRLIQLKMADNLAQNPEMAKYRIDQLKEIPSIIDEIIADNECFKLSDLTIKGKDIIDLGVPEGKWIGVILNQCLDSVIEGKVENDKESLLDLSRRLIGSIKEMNTT